MINNVVLQGRLVADPEVKDVGNDWVRAWFKVAVQRNFKNKETNEYEADFITCEAWGHTAKFVEEYFHKGDMLGLEGEIRTGQYENKDGQTVYTTTVNVNRVHFMTNKGGNDDGNSNINQEDPQLPFDI